MKEAGRMDIPGRPILYQVTDTFMRLSFRLESLQELPQLPKMEMNLEEGLFERTVADIAKGDCLGYSLFFVKDQQC